MNAEEAWRTWWEAEGKHMERLPHHNAIDHMASVTRIAWLNGAFEAADEIERLRMLLCAAESVADAKHDIPTLIRERDQARRMYCLDMAHDGNTPGDIAYNNGWDCFRGKTP